MIKLSYQVFFWKSTPGLLMYGSVCPHLKLIKIYYIILTNTEINVKIFVGEESVTLTYLS